MSFNGTLNELDVRERGFDALYVLFVDIRWQSIGIEWQNVIPALKWLHKLQFIWSTFWKNDLLKEAFVVSKIGNMRFSMAHVRMNIAPCYWAYQTNFYPRTFTISCVYVKAP